jgi:2,5-diketo-D-gluconate reductase A
LLPFLMQPDLAAPPKANQREHLNENIRVFDFQISKQDMASVSSLNERYSSLGSLPYD